MIYVLFLLATFMGSFLLVDSAIFSPIRSILTSKKLGDRVSGFFSKLLSCWACSGFWSALGVYLVSYPVVHRFGTWFDQALVAEFLLLTFAGAAFSYMTGKMVDFINSRIQVLSPEEFDLAAQEIKALEKQTQ